MGQTAAPSGRPEAPLFRNKVLHALVGVLLVFVCVRGGLLWWEHGRTLQVEQRRAENLAHVLAEHLGRTFGAIESAINQLAVHADRLGGPKAPPGEWSKVLFATLSGLSGIGSLNILDADGFVVMSTNPSVTGMSRRGRYLHRRLKDEPSEDLVIGPAAPAEHISGIRIPVGRALHDANGKFTGFLAATFQPERMRGFYEAIDVGPHGTILVFHRDGNLLFSQPHTKRPSGKPVIGAAIRETVRGGTDTGFRRGVIEAGGEPQLTAWRSLPGAPLVVAVSIAESDALAGWYTEIVPVAGSAVGMALLLALAGMWITASSRDHARTVAERDRVGTELQRQQAQFQAFIDHSPSGIVLKDQDGRFLIANRKMQEWMCRPASAIVGKTGPQLMGGEDVSGLSEQDRRVATTGQVTIVEDEMTFPDGVSRRVSTTKFPVRLGDDDSVIVGGIMTDVTSAREAEERLRQSQKMEAVGQLTGGVAHDFNNMLTAIIGNLALLADPLEGNDEAQGYLETATRAALRSGELTNRLLAFSRRQPLAPVSTDVNALVADCMALLQRTIGADIAVEVRPGEDAWHALVDRNQLENALLNLAINARDAMPGGGKLTIETQNVDLDADYAARTSDVTPGPHVMIALSDTGTGMAPEVLRRVFEPFFTTKPQGRGTGLGLSMVYGFAKQSGGHLTIYSEPGHGTTVKIFLPRATDDALDGTGQQAPPCAEAPRGTESILVVEDDPDVAAFVAAALGSLGYRVSQACDGPSAVRLLPQLDEVGLLLTDVILPNGMNGLEIADKVRLAFPDARVVFMSGYAESVIVHKGRLDEGVDFLAKPFARDTLASKVRASLDAGRAVPGRQRAASTAT